MVPCPECRRLEDQALEAFLAFVSLVQLAETAERQGDAEELRKAAPLVDAARARRADAAEALWRHNRSHSAHPRLGRPLNRNGETAAPLNLISFSRPADEGVGRKE